MARTAKRVGIRIALGLLLLPALIEHPGSLAWSQPRSTRTHIALNTALDCYRQGNYEMADNFFRQALAGQHDLTTAERDDLVAGLQRNQTALQAREEGAEQLHRAAQALQAGRTQEASHWLKEVAANQFLVPADKQKMMKLQEQLGAATAGANLAAHNARLVQARVKLQQARLLMSKENWDMAAAMAREVEGQGLAFPPGEDSPRLVLEDIARARTGKHDARDLLASGRSALERGDLERAEQLARQAEQATSFWSFNLWGDSPSRLLKDVQAARTRAGADPGRSDPSHSPREKEKGGALGSFRGLFTRSGAAPEGQEPNKVPNGGTPAHSMAGKPRSDSGTGTYITGPYKPQVPGQQQVTGSGSPGDEPRQSAQGANAAPGGDSSESREPALKLLTQGRRALAGKDLHTARKLATQAQMLRPELNWWEDSPAKLLSDIERAERARPSPNGNPVPPAENANTGTMQLTKAVEPPTPMPPAREGVGDLPKVSGVPLSPLPAQNVERARALLRQGRQAMQNNDMMRARQFCEQARLLKPDLDFWEDNPEKLSRDLDRLDGGSQPPAARATRPAESAPQPKAADPRAQLKEARALLNAGKLDEAKGLALQANANEYAHWGLLEDTPERLLLDIQKAQQRKNQEEAARLLVEARELLQKAVDNPRLLDEAESKAYRAERLHGPYGAWDLGDRPQKVLAEIHAIRARSKTIKVPPAPLGPGNSLGPTRNAGSSSASLR